MLFTPDINLTLSTFKRKEKGKLFEIFRLSGMLRSEDWPSVGHVLRRNLQSHNLEMTIYLRSITSHKSKDLIYGKAEA